MNLADNRHGLSNNTFPFNIDSRLFRRKEQHNIAALDFRFKNVF